MGRACQIFATVLLACLAAGCGGGSRTPTPDFRLFTMDGELFGPADFPGEVVVVDFWATWCQPCQVQSRILHSVHAESKADPVRFLAVDLGEDEATVRAFLERHPSPFPVLLDPENTLSFDLGINSLPTLMIVDTQGSVVYFEPGVITADRLRGLLRSAR